MTTGIRHDDLRRRNRTMVLAAIRRSPGPSRTEIAGKTGLSHSTISAISSDLIAEGILVQLKGAEAVSLKRGRPQVALGLNPDVATVVTIMLSLNVLSVSLIDYSGQTIRQESTRLPTQTLGREELSEAVISLVAGLLPEPDNARRAIMRITMAIQGITDAQGRKLLWSPITPHTDIPFADILEHRFTAPATVENDCNMIAVALRERAPERHRDNLVAVLLSNGIGMGLILGGNLFVGPHSSGGEFGHMIHVPGGALCRCGRQGCIEAYAGNYAIVRNSRLLDEGEAPEADIDDDAMVALARLARECEGPEREAFRTAGRALGYGLGSLFALIDPAPVTIVGPGTAAFDIIEPALREALSSTAGGQHASGLEFQLESDERPFVREGSARQGLAFIDEEIFAPGGVATSPRSDVA